MNIKDSIFIVTGGSAGIGKATAKMLIEKGGKVLITGRDKVRLEKTAQEIGALAVQADVAKEKDVIKTYEVLKKEFGKLDCLINNAGIGGEWEDVFNLTYQNFLDVYSVNVFGAAMMAREAAKIFKQQNYGNIVNISSTAGTKGFANGTVYSSSKFALRGMTQC